MRLYLYFLVPILLCIGVSQCLQFGAMTDMFGSGGCPDVPKMENFTLSEFEGIWYVREQVGNLFPFSNCQVFNITKTPLGSTRIETAFNKRLLLLSQRVSVAGTILQKSKDKANMKVSWDSVLGLVRFVVVNTDYDNWAVISQCHSFGAFHVKTAAVLSRTIRGRILDIGKINQVKKELSSIYDLANYKKGMFFCPFTIFDSPEAGYRKASKDAIEAPPLFKKVISSINGIKAIFTGKR